MTANQTKTILVVEDDNDIRDIIKEVLEDKYHVLTANNGKEALIVLGTHKNISLILLDLMMPVMNGWEFLNAIKKESSFKHIPVVVVSAFIEQSKKINCNEFLEKPIDLSQLLGLAEKYVH